MEVEERWDRLCSIFEAAGELPPSEQESYVRAQSGGDDDMVREVLELLSHRTEAASFLLNPHPAALRQPPAGDPMLSDGTVLEGRFEIRRFMGRGGMGEVYEAFDRELSVVVALKILRPEIATTASLERFKEETQLARRVTHPNVCRIFDFGRATDPATSRMLHFLTMEFLDGETLAERLQNNGPLPRTEALRCIRHIIEGLAAAHRLKIIHRDIKSSNVMLVPSEDGSVRVVITDFGLAYSLGRSVDGNNEPAAGTPFYMAPEQYGRGPISPATDIYAVGVVLHEMLTGHRPFGTEALSRFLENLAQSEKQPAVQMQQGLDARTARVILRCLETNPENRYPDCAALCGDLFQPPLFTRRRAVVLGVGAALAAAAAWGLRGCASAVPGRVSRNAEANTLCQKARLHLRRLTTDDLKKAITYFDQAIGLDAEFALAHSGRADAYSILTDYGGTPQKEAAQEALRSARRAVALSPSMAEAHASLGLALSNNLPIWRTAESSFREAIRLDPNYAYTYHWFGSHLSRLVRTGEAIASMQKAVKLDPVSLPTSATLGFMYYFARRYNEALEQGLRTVDLDPNFRYGYLLLTRAYTELNQIEKAADACENGIRLSGNAPVFASALACIRLRQGDRAAARQILDGLEVRHAAEHIPALYLASLHSRLGEADHAFRWLYKGWDSWESSILLVRAYPHFDSLRGDSRYSALLQNFQLT